jgi:glycosyltransferase involved in cell wall biosynthesis
MNRPLASVVIPTFNRVRRIVEAVSSVLRQDYESIEVIVVDDSSNDGTPGVVAGMREANPNVRYLLNRRGRGPSRARNDGILECEGKYIAFLDSDDVWAEDHLRPAIDLLETHPEVDVVFGNLLNKNTVTGETFTHFDDKVALGKIRKSALGDGTFVLQESLFAALVQESFLMLPSVVARSQLLKRALLNEAVTYSEDRDLGIRLEKDFGARFAMREVPTYIRSIGKDNLCSGGASKTIRMYLDHVALFRGYLATYDLSAGERKIVHQELFSRHMALSWAYRQNGQRRQAAQNAISALRLAPGLPPLRALAAACFV